ncbi:ZIP family metal transporter [Ureibacillus composti]|nr:ZIP family metal transporter [Ureibacillus composti]
MFITALIGMGLTTIGFCFGGCIAILLKGFQTKVSIIYAICAGVILGMIVLDIAPESIEMGNNKIFFWGLLMGGILFLLLHEASHQLPRYQVKKNPYLRTAKLLALSISVHNLPVGIAIGSSQVFEMNSSMIYLLILHNIPEGVALFTPLLLGKVNIRTWFMLIGIIIAPVGIGILLGSSLGYFIPPSLCALILSLAIGMMLTVTIKEMFIVAIKNSSARLCIIYTIIGFILIWIYLLLI